MKRSNNPIIDYSIQYQSLYTNSRDIILFIRKRDGQILEANVSACNAYQYSREELLSMTIYDLRSPDTYQDVEPQMAEAESSGLLFETYHRRKNGEIFAVEVSSQGTLIRGEKALLSIIRNITERKQAEKKLIHIMKAVESTSDAIGISDRLGHHIYQNKALSDLFGYSTAEELEAAGGGSAVVRDTKVAKEMFDTIMGGKSWSGELEMVTKSGRVFPAFERADAIKDNEGNLVGLIGIITDITESRQVQGALQASNELFSLFMHHSPIFTYIKEVTPTQSFVLQASENYREMIGIPGCEMVGKTMEELFPPEFAAKITADDRAVISKGEALSLDEELNGRSYTTIKFPIVRGDKTLLAGYTIDITDRKRAEEALQESERRYRDLSTIDGLTQLYNSRYFYHQLRMEIDRGNRYNQPLTLLLLDLDDFKQFNDNYGHIEGDQVLFRLGQVVKRWLRQTDSVYRYGGEEFTVLLPMTTSEEGVFTAERIRAEFKKESFSPIPDQEVHVTVSIGLAQYKPQEEMKTFVHRVDQLMYQGKKNGKDRVCSEL